MIFKEYYDGEHGALFKKFDEVLEIVKYMHPDKYRDIKNDIYVLINGYHFNESMLEEALESMDNEDGTKGGKWSLEDTNSLANSAGIRFEHFNEYDWNYTLNMLYSDYYSILGTSANNYANMAKKFLMDKDAPEGKALRYYMAMK